MQTKRLDNKMIFQQDGAPPHSSKEVHTKLNEKFTGRWIGRSGPISWTPRFPDLTLLDFFYGDTLKQKYTKQSSKILPI